MRIRSISEVCVSGSKRPGSSHTAKGFGKINQWVQNVYGETGELQQIPEKEVSDIPERNTCGHNGNLYARRSKQRVQTPAVVFATDDVAVFADLQQTGRSIQM